MVQRVCCKMIGLCLATAATAATAAAAAGTMAPRTVVMDKHFKWNLDLHPTWTSVFAGTNDHNPHFPFFATQLAAFPPQALELVTVVGGGAYLRLLEATTFGRIHFFDSNINELTKLRALHADIIAHEYDAWLSKGGTAMVDRLFRTRPAELYLPHALASDGVGVRAAPDFSWPIPGSHFFDAGGRRSPLWTMLEPDAFPEFAWRPSREGYARVRAMLMRNGVVANDFHLSLPCAVTRADSIAVVYVNGAQIPAAAVRAVSPSGMAIGIYSVVETAGYASWDGTGESKLGLRWWRDAHLWWELSVRRVIAAGRSVHVWAPEDKEYQGTIYDWFFDTSVLASDFVVSTADHQVDAEIVTFHMLLGKAKSACTARHLLFLQALKKALQAASVQQVIVTEHNRDSQQFDESHPCVSSAGEIRAAVESVVNAPDVRGFRVESTQAIPGEGVHNRNYMLVVERMGDETAEAAESLQCQPSSSSSSPSSMITISVDGKDEPVFFPLDGNKATFKALAAVACTSYEVLEQSCVKAIQGKLEAVQRQLKPFLNPTGKEFRKKKVLT